MAKRQPTLLWKLKIALVLQFEDAKFPPEMAKNCLTQKLFNYLLFWGLAPEILFFRRKCPKQGSKKPSFWAKIVSPRNYLIICCFSPFIFLQSLTLLLYFAPIFPLSLPFFLSLTLSLPLSRKAMGQRSFWS